MSNEANKDQQTTRHSVDDFLSEFYELAALGYIDFVDILSKSVKISDFGSDCFWLKDYCKLWIQITYSDYSKRDPIKNMKLAYLIQIHGLNLLITHLKVTRHPQQYYLMALYYYNCKLYNKSIELFQNADDQFGEKHSPTFYCDFAAALFSIKDFNRANEKFKLAEKIAPNKWWIYNKWANCLSIHGFTEEAIKKDAQAFNLEPKSEVYFIDQGIRIIKENVNYQDKLDELIASSINFRIDYYNLYKKIGIRFYEDMEYEKAEYILKKGITINDHDWELRSYYAMTLFYKQEFQEALNELNMILDFYSYEKLDKKVKTIYRYLMFFSIARNRKKGENNGNQLSLRNPGKFVSLHWSLYFGIGGDLFTPLAKVIHRMPKDFFWVDVLLLLLLPILLNVFLIIKILKSLYKGFKITLNFLVNIRLYWNSYFRSKEYISPKLSLIVNESGLSFPILQDIFNVPLVLAEEATPKKMVLVLNPKHPQTKKSEHINEISWYNQHGNELQKGDVKNNPFDFLYGIASLHKKGTRIELGKGLSNEQKSEIFPKYKDYKRFYSKSLTGDEAQMPKMKSEINKYFDFDFIIQEGIFYTINKEITVELNPYPT
tara:strand:- start:2173 stop:3978 length:1806 start_codon:yes stop_codon:yes gene_type:complete